MYIYNTLYHCTPPCQDVYIQHIIPLYATLPRCIYTTHYTTVRHLAKMYIYNTLYHCTPPCQDVYIQHIIPLYATLPRCIYTTHMQCKALVSNTWTSTTTSTATTGGLHIVVRLSQFIVVVMSINIVPL